MLEMFRFDFHFAIHIYNDVNIRSSFPLSEPKIIHIILYESMHVHFTLHCCAWILVTVTLPFIFAFLPCLLFIHRNLKEAVETKRAFAIPLRTLEVFTSPTWYDQMTECNREEHATSVSMHLAKNGGLKSSSTCISLFDLLVYSATSTGYFIPAPILEGLLF